MEETPFVALLLLAGLQGIDASLYEAARIDGASAWRQFRHITLPLLKPALLVALIFRTLDAFRVFDLMYVMTGGGPGTATEPIALYTFNSLLQNLRFGYGSALSVLVFLVAFLLALGYIRLVGADLTESGGEPAALAGRRSRSGCWSSRSRFPSTGPSSRRSRPRPSCSRRPRSCRPTWCWITIARCSCERDFWVPIRNSLVVAGTTTVFCVIVGSLCAYALARLRFRGKAPLLGAGARGEHVPADRGRLAALPAAAEPAASSTPIPDWSCPISPSRCRSRSGCWWGSSGSSPRSWRRRRMVDGAGRLRALREVIVPLAVPGLAATAILTFVYSWNEFLFALSFTLGPERQTVPVAIALFRGQYQVPWGQVLAAAIVATAPVAALVLAFQRRIVQGLTAGAVKG